MAATPADVKAAFQEAIPHRHDEFARRVRERLRSIVHENQYAARYPAEVLLLAEQELRARIELAANRVKQLINSGWTATGMVAVSTVFLDCFGTYDHIDKDPQSDLYRAVDAAFASVGSHDPAQATANARRLSEVQVRTATEFLKDLELYYAEKHPSALAMPAVEAGVKAAANSISHWEADVFICHASEDKDFVKDLAQRLRDSGVRVWYDDFEFTVGDSLRGRIDAGLVASRYGIVVLSPAFFSKQWPQLELDALITTQMDADRKVVLPVWHQITSQQIRSFSPLLAGRYAAKSSEGLDKVVSDLQKVLSPGATDAGAGQPPPAVLIPATFREQIIEFVQDVRELVLSYTNNSTDEGAFSLLMAYSQMSSRYFAIKHHLERKLGFPAVAPLARLPVPMTAQAILRTADTLENLAARVPDYLPAFPTQLDTVP